MLKYQSTIKKTNNRRPHKLEHQPMDNNYMKKSQRKSNLYNRRTARLTKRCIWVCIDM